MSMESSREIVKLAWPAMKHLHRITITDAWFPNEGGNVAVASQQSQKHSMNSVLSGIKQLGTDKGSAVLKKGTITQSRESWIGQGRSTLRAGQGICTDCAAAAAVTINDYVNQTEYEADIEIISSGTHAFVVVNREGDLHKPEKWPKATLVADIWYANQYPQHSVPPIFWFFGTPLHPVADFIYKNKTRLRIDANIRASIDDLF